MDNKRLITIAIDGFSSSGKSTMAKKLAKTIGYVYIDTGAMYRAVTLYCLRNGLFDGDRLDTERLEAALPDINITFGVDADGKTQTMLNGEVVEQEIRRMEVSSKVSIVAAVGSVRRALVKQQQAMGKQKGIVMDGRDIGTVVFDKTGTLTKGVFQVLETAPEGMDAQTLLGWAAQAECYSGHPISQSLKAAWSGRVDADRVTDVEELGGFGLTAQVDGHAVAVGNRRLMEKLDIRPAEPQKAGTVVYVAVDGVYAGFILLGDVVKEHAVQAIRSLKAEGIEKTVMLTGDADAAARQVASQLGVDEVHSQLLPADKVRQVERLLQERKDGRLLAFVGDGINDAPVLARADIGIAMGALGSDAAIEAADVVLMDDDPAKIALAMRISRRTLRIVYENIVFALAVKAVCLVLGAIGIANMWLAIGADVGVMVLAVLNATRALSAGKE